MPFGLKPQALIFLISTVLTVLFGLILLPALRKFKFRQTVRDDGPTTHFVKMGTPTMGGIIFLIPLVLISIFLLREYPDFLALVSITTLFGAIGFMDDMLKIKKHSKDGLYASQKMLLLIIIATAFTFYMAYFSDAGTEMIIPFAGIESTITLPVWIYVPFIIFAIISVTNAVNLTDGLDGLAAGVTLVVFVFFTIVATTVDEWKDIVLFSASIAGGCLGFLAFNIHPAKMFMGDTGSLALGGAVIAISIMMKMPWIILIIGFIYVIEALSVVLQVVSFKLTGKRIFKMSPIHHHFELSGWSENKIVLLFIAVTIVMCIIGFIALCVVLF